MRIVEVFPDYCSTGLWDRRTHINLDESSISGHVPKHMLIALKYWHLVWELRVDSNNWTSCSLHAIEWESDGIKLVEAMNSIQREFLFVYVGNNFREKE